MSLHTPARLIFSAFIGSALAMGSASAGAEQSPAPPLGGVDVPAYGLIAASAGGAMRNNTAGAAEVGPDGSVIRGFKLDTAVRIASVSKMVVALALHRLADAGELQLDDDVSQHLGWTLRNPSHPGVPITIRQMMRHESSVSDAGGYISVLGERLRDKIGPASFSAAAPGTAFDYANLNQAILGEMIERVTGKRFDQAMQELVLGPLQIDACFNWSGCSPDTIRNGAVLYRKAPSDAGPWNADGPWIAQVDERRPPDTCPVRLAEGTSCDLSTYIPGTNGALFSPQGGLRISISELAALGLAILRNEGFLKHESRESLFRPIAVKPAGSGDETDTKLMQYWSEGGFHCFSGTGQPGGDQPLSPQPLKGCGHLGSAFGLLSGLIIDPDGQTVLAYALTGTSLPPPPGTRSRFSAPEEDLIGRAGTWLKERSDRQATP